MSDKQTNEGFTIEEFTEELISRLSQKEEWGLSGDCIRLYKDGFTADGDATALDFIHDTNIRYHKTEADVLIGDFIVITAKNKSKDKFLNMCRFETAFLYERFQQKGWDAIWKLVQSNLDLINLAKESDTLSLIENYPAFKDRLIIRPINYTDHRLELKNCIYKRVGDIALVLYMVISDSREHNLLNTAKVQKAVLQYWDTGESQVWEEALLNTYVLAPPRMYINPLDAANPPYERGAFMAIGSELNKILPMQIPTVTTTKQTNGAIALFYPGIKEKIAEMAGGSFYAAFTSIHEAAIHCKGPMSPRKILQNLKYINTKFDPAEILSRKVFYYDAQTKDFSALERV